MSIENNIHPTASVHPTAKLTGVTVGAYAVIGPNVEIGEGTEIYSHAVIYRNTTMGRGNKVYSFASVGCNPQHIEFDEAKDEVFLVIGDHNVIHEYTTISLGTVQGESYTRIGNHNLFMAYSHIAHDCQISNHTRIVNHAQLAGHIIVEDYAIVGCFASVHQFCRIGQHSFIPRSSSVSQDVLPFVMVTGIVTPKVIGVNAVGLQRRDFSLEQIEAIKEAYRIVFRSKHPLQVAIDHVRELSVKKPVVMPMLTMLESSTRGFVR